MEMVHHTCKYCGNPYTPGHYDECMGKSFVSDCIFGLIVLGVTIILTILYKFFWR